MARRLPLALLLLCLACAEGELLLADVGPEVGGFLPPVPNPTGFDAARPLDAQGMPRPDARPFPSPGDGAPPPLDAARANPDRGFLPPDAGARPPDMGGVPQDPACPGFAFTPPQPIAIQAFDVAYISPERFAQVQMGVEGEVQAGQENADIRDGRVVGEGAPYRYTWTVEGLARGSWTFTFSAAAAQGAALQGFGRCVRQVQ